MHKAPELKAMRPGCLPPARPESTAPAFLPPGEALRLVIRRARDRDMPPLKPRRYDPVAEAAYWKWYFGGMAQNRAWSRSTGQASGASR